MCEVMSFDQIKQDDQSDIDANYAKFLWVTEKHLKVLDSITGKSLDFFYDSIRIP